MSEPTGKIFVPIERESPAGRQHLHTLQAGAWLPVMQATITGFITFIVITVLAYNLRARSPWNWGSSAGVIAWGFTWLSLQRHWFSLTKLEQVTGLDLNRDGFIGAPTAPVQQPPTVHVSLSDTTNGSLHITNFNLPASDSQMAGLAYGLSRGSTLSERNWTGAGRLFSVENFRALRIEMQRRGLVRLASEKDPRQGYILTPAGKAVLKHYLPPPG